jgi:hypothetical protein
MLLEPDMIDAATNRLAKCTRTLKSRNNAGAEHCYNIPLDSLQSSLAVKTPEAEMVSLQITSLKGFLG